MLLLSQVLVVIVSAKSPETSIASCHKISNEFKAKLRSASSRSSTLNSCWAFKPFSEKLLEPVITLPLMIFATC